jgi:flagellar hook-basal body complex protein FliE
MNNFGIDPVLTPKGQALAPEAARKTEGQSPLTAFGEYLEGSLGEVSRMQKEADLAATKLMTGENKDIHNTMIKAQKAEISFQLIMQIRNKIISAYEELQRMQF